MQPKRRYLAWEWRRERSPFEGEKPFDNEPLYVAEMPLPQKVLPQMNFDYDDGFDDDVESLFAFDGLSEDEAGSRTRFIVGLKVVNDAGL